ncbi:MAG: UvrD-helicase domain-containing protein [bacterium]|jgi:ATP-dependent helicase/nuclease subunit A
MKNGPVNWTMSQRKAIEAVDRRILVSAAAGAGKTSVLIQRYLKLLIEGNAPERILAITFTRKAASQLKIGVINRLVESNDRNLELLIPRITQAPVGTIHSFCLQLIREFAGPLSLPADFAILDEDKSRNLKEIAIGKTIAEMASSKAGQKRYAQLLRSFGTGRGDEWLHTLVLDLADFFEKLPQPRARSKYWLGLYDEVKSAESFWHTTWGKLYKDALTAEIEKIRRELEWFETEFRKSAIPAAWREAIYNDVKLLSEFLSMDTEKTGAMNDFLSGASWTPRYPAKCNIYELDRTKESWVKFRNRIKSDFRKTWLVPELIILSELKKFSSSQILPELIDLVYKYTECFSKIKLRLKMLDFSDLERYAHTLLAETAASNKHVAEVLADRFDHILIDEYQDTSPIQDAIFECLSQRAKMFFMVGDVKQSIYRFRHAEPDLFVNRLNLIRKGKDESSSLIDLPDNFRSVKPVIDVVNAVFSRIFSENFGGIDYCDGHKLISGAGNELSQCASGCVTPHVSLKLILSSGTRVDDKEVENDDFDTENAGGDFEETDLSRKELEASLVAREILSLVNSVPAIKVIEENDGQKRPVPISFRHVALILSAPVNWVDTYAEVFGRYGIPFWFSAGGSAQLMSDPLSRDLLSILRVIDNPLQDIPLSAVLLGPLVGLTPDYLLAIRSSMEHCELLFDAVVSSVTSKGYNQVLTVLSEALGESAPSEELMRFATEERLKIERFLEWLTEMRQTAQSDELSEVVLKTIRDSNLDSLARLGYGTADSSSRLEWFAGISESMPPGGLGDLIKKASAEDKIELPTSAVGDRVQITSIHQAKGLEFPIVIAAGLGHKFRFDESKRAVIFDREIGFGCRLLHPNRHATYPSPPYRIVERALRHKMLEEEARKLYVSLTRARERLIMVGSVRESAFKVSYAARRTAKNECIRERDEACNFMDWLMPIFIEAKPVYAALESIGVQIGGIAPQGLDADLSCDVFRESELKAAIGKETLPNLALKTELGMDVTPLNEAELKIPDAVLFKYPFSSTISIPRKISASSLSKYDDPEGLRMIAESFEPRDASRNSHNLRNDSLRLGSAVHILMSNLPFGCGVGINPEETLAELVSLGKIAESDASNIEMNRIHSFLETPLGRFLSGKGFARTEWRFLLRLNREDFASEPRALRALTALANPNMPQSSAISPSIVMLNDDDFVVAQGAVDLIFECDRRRILVDWKTDAVDMAEVNGRAENYFLQMWVYIKAVEAGLGPVDSAKLVFLTPGVAVEVT